MRDAGAHVRDQTILVFGKWTLLKTERLQLLPADFIEAKAERC